MGKIKILLAIPSQMIRGLVEEIRAQSDMEIVGEHLDPLPLLLAAKETKANAAIVASRNSREPGLVSHLLAECPNMIVLGLGDQGHIAFIVQMCPWRKEIIDPSEANILSALRHAIQEPCHEVNQP
jgi:6-phosphogluconolactonase/glucosamine-6-phosphate isomerase/deaminase